MLPAIDTRMKHKGNKRMKGKDAGKLLSIWVGNHITRCFPHFGNRCPRRNNKITLPQPLHLLRTWGDKGSQVTKEGGIYVGVHLRQNECPSCITEKNIAGSPRKNVILRWKLVHNPTTDIFIDTSKSVSL